MRIRLIIAAAVMILFQRIGGLWAVMPLFAGLWLTVREEVEMPVDWDLETQWLMS